MLRFYITFYIYTYIPNLVNYTHYMGMFYISFAHICAQLIDESPRLQLSFLSNGMMLTAGMTSMRCCPMPAPPPHTLLGIVLN